MLTLSLFPGIGLLDLAFELEGYCVVRGPDVLWGGDVRAFHPPAGRFDGVIGGPPCQSFSSLARLVRACGREPKFGNLIPEFERCVSEAAPTWFLMENVPQAPEPAVTGYGVRSFLLDNSALAGEGGWGLEQRRVRRFSFGVRGVWVPPCLLRWVDLAVFLLPDATGAITQWPPDNSQGAKGRRSTVAAGHNQPDEITRWSKAKKAQRHETLTGGHGRPPGQRRTNAVTSSKGGTGKLKRQAGRPDDGKGRYKLPDACRLQGLPEDFLSDSPFTAEGKLKAIANGVPLPMGRAIAKAIREAVVAPC